MADGYAQATGRVTHVNLHTAPGVGNAVGGIFNAQSNKSPLLVTAGQQVRAQITMEANLTNRDATYGPQPYVKWSHEPPRAQDVPAALARAIHHASLPPRGPAFVSIPMDDWAQEADAETLAHTLARTGRTAAPSPDPAALAALAGRIAARAQPGADRRSRHRSGGRLGRRGGARRAPAAGGAGRRPRPGGGRLGFPENHPNFQGLLAPAIGPAGDALAEYDLVLVVGSSVFPYYPYIPGPLLARGHEPRADHLRPGRGGARADGRGDRRRRRRSRCAR